MQQAPPEVRQERRSNILCSMPEGRHTVYLHCQERPRSIPRARTRQRRELRILNLPQPVDVGLFSRRLSRPIARHTLTSRTQPHLQARLCLRNRDHRLTNLTPSINHTHTPSMHPLTPSRRLRKSILTLSLILHIRTLTYRRNTNLRTHSRSIRTLAPAIMVPRRATAVPAFGRIGGRYSSNLPRHPHPRAPHRIRPKVLTLRRRRRHLNLMLDGTPPLLG